MPGIEQNNNNNNNNMPISLHYALTDSQCSICGRHLEWKADFENINQPKYVSQHCNQDYAIHIETVKIVVSGKASEDKQREQLEKDRVSMKQDEPKALKMAEAMKRQQQQVEEEKQR
jgi:hypothetical protein